MPALSHNFHPTSLREYDIRGIVGQTLGPDDAYAIGRGFGTLVRRAGGSKVAVGRDGRESEPLSGRPVIASIASRRTMPPPGRPGAR